MADDHAVNVATLFFEARLAVEVVVIAIDKLKDLPEAKVIAEQLQLIRGYADQAGDALEALQRAIGEQLGIAGPSGSA